MITVEDWRAAPPETLAPLYDAECTRWYQALGWDYRPSCGLIEAARVGGRLPGLIAWDESRAIAGWSYFLPGEDALQIGNLVGRDADTVRALLRALVSRPEASRARRLSCFLFPSAAAVQPALKRARFSLLRHDYLKLALGEGLLGAGPRPATAAGRASSAPTTTVAVETESAPPTSDVELCPGYRLREWSPDIIPDLLGLLTAAYEGTREARCFAPDGEVGEWATYVHQLVQTPACGRFERSLSFGVETAAGEMTGAILVSALSVKMAHVAQMAVAPGHRRRGLGEWMVRAACARARQARYEAVTLLVAESNERARPLYDRLGFLKSAEFVFAERQLVDRR